ncbi:MAG: hypothetical protein WDA22_17450 [Bacteroidota bacterium]
MKTITVKIFRLALLIVSIGNLASSQIASKGSANVGASLETIFPNKYSSGLGYAVSLGYFLSDEWSVSLDYSKIRITDKIFKYTWDISAPAIFMDYHIIPRNNFDFLLSLGVGQTKILGSADQKSFFYSSGSNKSMVFPQGRIHMRYQISPLFMIRAGVGFYRPISIAVEYIFN